MGKRKKSSRGPQGPKKREPLATTFQCLFCNHEKSVTIKMYKKEGVGQLDCRICGQSYQTSVNYLSAPVDVYSDWIDACEAVQDRPGELQPTVASESSGHFQTLAKRSAPAPRTGGGEVDDLDGFIENDEDDEDGRFQAD